MFVRRAALREAIRSGRLKFDPEPSDDDLGDYTIALRLGTDFALYDGGPEIDLVSPRYEPFPMRIQRVSFGSSITLNPRETLIGVSLQTITLPPDLGGLVFQAASIARIGLLSPSGHVLAGFWGKISLPLFNLGGSAVRLFPGSRVAYLGLFPLSHAPSSQLPVKRAGVPFLTRPELASKVHGDIPKRPLPLGGTRRPVPPRLSDHLKQALAADARAKGPLLESFVERICGMIDGVRILKANARLRSEEIDLLLHNDSRSGVWQHLGSPIVVECKNWKARVSAKEVGAAADKLESLGPAARTVLLVAPLGITGKGRNDARLKLREYRQRGKVVLVLTEEHLGQIAEGAHPSDVIQRVFDQIWLI